MHSVMEAQITAAYCFERNSLNWEGDPQVAQLNKPTHCQCNMWYARHLLSQAEPVISFSDVKDLLVTLVPTTTHDIITEPHSYGRKMKFVASQAEWSQGKKLGKLALLFVHLICELRMDSTCQAAINLLYLKESECSHELHGQNVLGLMAIKDDYVRIRLATKRKLGFQPDPVADSFVEVYLHRIVNWLAHGEPPVVPGKAKAMALHSCAEKGCLNFGCLRWGDASNNANDAYLHEHQARNAGGRQRAPKRRK